MTLSVVTPPSAVITPANIAGSHASNDASVAAMIAAVTAELDAPYGWLGRAIGRQTLRMTLPDWGEGRIRLRCPPIVSITSVTYIDTDGATQTLAADKYRVADGWLVPAIGQQWPTPASSQPDAVNITYLAGFDPVPDGIKHALILMTQSLKKAAADSGSSAGVVVFEDVEGVGQIRYEASKDARAYVRDAASSLLSAWRVWA